MNKNIFQRMGFDDGGEDDVAASPAPPSVAHAFPQTAFIMPTQTPPPVYPTGFPAVPTALTVEDQQSLKALSGVIYATPSTYSTFAAFRAKMGAMPVKDIFDLLSAANASVTPPKVVADIDNHLGMIEAKRSEFVGRVQQARTSKVETPRSQIADLHAKIQAAQQQITDMTMTANQLEIEMKNADKGITEGEVHFNLVIEALKAPLVQTKQLIGAMG